MAVSTFPPEDLCINWPRLDVPDDICLPGGLCLSYVWDAIGKIPHLSDMNMDFFSQIGPAMAPLKPFFDVLNTVLQIYKCVMAIPKSIMTLNPSELLECIPLLAELVDYLLKLIPYLSIPKMVIAIIRNMAALLRSIAADRRYIQSQLQEIANMIDRAAELNDVKMNGFLTCAQRDLEDTTYSTAQALEGIGRLILLVNIFIGLFGGPEIPCFGELVSANLSERFDVLVELLTTVAEVLDEIADRIPDPDLVLTLALGDQRC